MVDVTPAGLPMRSDMDVHTSTVICAWCNRTVMIALVRTSRTQAICQACADWAFSHQPLEFDGLADADHIDLPPRDAAKIPKH